MTTDYLENGRYPADVNNRDFVKAFGTHLDDGRSAERAFDFITRVARGDNPRTAVVDDER